MKALSLLAVFLMTASLAVASSASITTVSVQGRVEFKSPNDTAWQLLTAGTTLGPGFRVKSYDNGEAIFGTMPGLASTIKENTEIIFTSVVVLRSPEGTFTQRKARIELMDGRIVFLLQKEDDLAQRDNASIDLQIKTPQGVASPRGTFFAVMVIEGKSYVAVKEGQVGREQFQPLEDEGNFDTDPLASPLLKDFGSRTTTSPRG